MHTPHTEKKTALKELAKLINYFKTIPNTGIEEMLPELRELWLNAYNGNDAPPIFQIAKLLNTLKYKTDKEVKIVQGWDNKVWSLIVKQEKVSMHRLMRLPSTAKVYWEIEEYICKNHNHYSGVSVNSPTMGHKFTAYQVNKEYKITVDAYDVLATMRYMVEMNNLVSTGFFGSIETFSVNREVSKWEDTHKGE